VLALPHSIVVLDNIQPSRYHHRNGSTLCSGRSGKITPSQRRQEIRLQSAQNISRKDAARVLQDAAQNGVNNIDWGQRNTYGGPVSAERIRARQIDRTSPRASGGAPGPDVERKDNPNPKSPFPSSQLPRSEKLPLRIPVPVHPAAPQVAHKSSPDIQRIIPLESSVPTSVLAELQGSTVAGKQADATGPGTGSSYGSRWVDSRESAADHDNKSAATVQYRKWPGAYPESDLGGE
jgi:hypothetical protein